MYKFILVQLFLLIFFSFILDHSESLYAQDNINKDSSNIPCQCLPEKYTKKYNKGINSGKSIVQKNWLKYDSCDLIDDFTEKIMKKIDKIELKSEDEDRIGKRCKFAGVVEGIFLAFDQIQDECMNECMNNGKLIGKIAAKTFCELAIESDGQLNIEEWIRKPVNLCGFNYEVSCDGSFIGDSRSYSNEDGVCSQYTENEFFELWDNSRLKACDYYEQTP